jgi:hypothetical protein
MTKKEVENLKEDIPATMMQGDKYQLGLAEKREAKVFIDTFHCSVNSNLHIRH